MDEILGVINAYNDLLYDIYKREELICLSDNGYVYKGMNVLSFSNPAIVKMAKIGLYDYLSEVTDKLKMQRFNDMHAVSEIIVSTADLKYRLGTLFLYYPYIVKLQNSFYFHKGGRQFFYEQTRNDARFNRELPVAFECLYKYWQRLSDYLLNFFPDALLSCRGRSYFNTILEYIKKNHSNLCQSENFKWILNFSEDKYPEFNKKRKFFVHSAGYDNQFFQNFLNTHNEESNVISMDEERANLLQFLKEHLNLCIEGYFIMMAFINEIEFSVTNKEAVRILNYDLISK